MSTPPGELNEYKKMAFSSFNVGLGAGHRLVHVLKREEDVSEAAQASFAILKVSSPSPLLESSPLSLSSLSSASSFSPYPVPSPSPVFSARGTPVVSTPISQSERFLDTESPKLQARSLEAERKLDAESSFPYKKIRESLTQAIHPDRVGGSPISENDLDAIKIFFDHHLSAFLNSKDENGQPFTEIRRGYVFKHDGITYTLPRTIEIINNLGLPGRTPYLLLNRVAIIKGPGEIEIIDGIISCGSAKVVKKCIDLTTGILRARATMPEDEFGLNEITQLIRLNGSKGILPTLGYLKFVSKKKDKDEKEIRKIAIISPYCPEGDICNFIINNRLQTLFPDKVEHEKQKFHMVKSGLEAMKSFHTPEIVQIDGVDEVVRNVHCDIKPDNFLVYLDEKGNLQLFLFDFGMARQEGVYEKSLGSLAYLAPRFVKEFTRNKKLTYDPSHDMWAFGLTAFVIKHFNLPGNDFSEVANKNNFEEIFSFVNARTKEWQAKQRNSFLDGVKEYNAKDPIDLLAYKCLLMDPTRRITANIALRQFKPA
jgi:hypothetical protein